MTPSARNDAMPGASSIVTRRASLAITGAAVADEAPVPVGEGEYGYCFDDPDGVYLFRGLSWPELAVFISEFYGSEPTVGGMIDLFCGIDRTLPPGGE